MVGQGRFGRAILSAPLVPVAGALAAGVAAESALGAHGLSYLAAIGVLLGVWAMLWGHKTWPALRFALLLAVVFVIGACRIGLVRHVLPADHIALRLSPGGELVTLEGELVSRPAFRRHLIADFAGAIPRDPDSSFLVRAGRLRRGLAPAETVSGLVQVCCTGPALHLAPGQRVELTGVLYPVPPTSNPGSSDFRRTSQDKRVFAMMSLPAESAAAISRPSTLGAEPVRPRLLDRLRLTARSLLLGVGNSLTEDDRGLLDGLLLGGRAEETTRLSGPFLRTGTYHYLAVSGLHVGILAWFCWFVLRLLRVSLRWSAAAVLTVVGLYCLMVEPRPPILRAGIMIAIMCLGIMLRRESWSLNSLAAAAIVLLLIDPGELFGAGFQLSFVVVAGLVLFAGPVFRQLYRSLLRHDPDEPDRASPWIQFHPLADRAVRVVLRTTAMAVAAWVAGLPLAAFYFHRFYPWSVVCTLALWPTVSAALVIGFAKMALATVAPTLAGWINGPLHTVSTVILATVNGLDRIPGMSVSVARPGAPAVAIYYGWLLLWKVRPRWLTGRLMFAGGAVGVLAWLMAAGSGERLELNVLDVGNGLAQVVRTPSGRTLLFDCGSRDRDDVCEQVVVPFLAWRGPPGPLRINTAFLSHGHLDHYSGLPGLARRGILAELVVSPCANPQGQAEANLRRLHALLAESGVTARTVSAGAGFQLGRMSGRLLWPPDWVDRLRPEFANDCSQVVRVCYAGRAILLTGDISEFAEQFLLDGHAAGQVDLRSDVLVMPHHGAVKVTTGDFLRAVGPKWIIISTARPAYQVLPRCPALDLPGRQVLFTSEHGAVRVTIGPDGRVSAVPFIAR